MPWVLTSELFRNNLRLQDCANEPANHVAFTDPPQTGEHVRLIQRALVQLGYVDFGDERELARSAYGPKTAELVRQFKLNDPGGKILGPGQLDPDPIAGVQTIRRLDLRMGGGNGAHEGGADDGGRDDLRKQINPAHLASPLVLASVCEANGRLADPAAWSSGSDG